jgi:tetratricopeptide (TPR) repeat protein
MSLFGRLFGLWGSARYNKGIEYFNQHRYDEAIIEFEAILASAKDRSDPVAQLARFYAAETHANLGLIRMRKGEYELAKREFEKAVKENPHYPDLQYYLGVAYERLGEFDKSISTLQKAIDINPDYVEARCYLVICLEEKGEHSRAREELLKAEDIGLPIEGIKEAIDRVRADQTAKIPFELLRAFADRKKEFPEMVERGLMHLASGEYAKAISVLEQAVRVEPTYPDVRCKLGIAYGENGDLEQAINEISEALRFNPTYVEALYHLGHFLGKSGRLKEAEEALTKGKELGGEYPEILRELGRIKLMMGRFRQALDDLKRAGELVPSDHEAKTLLAACYQVQGQSRDAAEALRTLTDWNAESCAELGTLWAEAGDWDRAIQAYSDSLERDPENQSVVARLGRALHATGKTDEAEERLRRSLEKEPSSSTTRLWLAQLLREKGKPLEAIDVLGDAGRWNGDSTEVWVETGLCYLDTDRLGDAEEYFQRACEADPSSTRARLYLVITLLGQRRIDQAIQQYEQLESREPSDLFSRMFLTHLAGTRAPVASGT